MKLESLRSLYGWLRRLFCRHKFEVSTYQSEFYGDVIVCGQTRVWTAKVQRKTCLKCGKTKSRRVSGLHYGGWE